MPRKFCRKGASQDVRIHIFVVNVICLYYDNQKKYCGIIRKFTIL